VAFQPRSRDRRHLISPYGEVATTAERRSHAVLGLARSCTVLSAQSETSAFLSIDTVPDDFSPDAVPPRPPFTRTATLFGALRMSLFEARMLLVDFCNCIRRTGAEPGSLVSSQGRWP
jgi:hypothetical protein